MPLSPSQLSSLAQHISEGLALPESARGEWLASLVNLDSEARLALERVFAANSTDANFELTFPKLALSNSFSAHHDDALEHINDVKAGEVLGSWRVERLLGIGGMGQVWLAARDDGRYEGRAAIKLIRSATQGANHQRFEAEGKLLARLQHPNIARLLDAGERGNGSAYLVLEYVEGAPVDQWADQHQLSVTDRLKLFLQICAAVSYAHANLVVHRDIKPSNILVQGDGSVKLLDFGVAKLLEDDASSALTIESGAALTPEYASPEQIDSGPISVATDVYSLGVLLFRLLAGVRPYDVKQPTRLQLVRAILDSAPRQLSTAISTKTDEQPQRPSDNTNPGEAVDRAHVETPTAQNIAALRGTTPQRLARALSGDLDTILATALKKAPAERYASVQAFADDIERHLQHKPIVARADSWGYRATKFVRRHWITVAATAAVFVATGGGVVATLWQANKAKLEAERANVTKDFLIGVFSANDTRIANEKPRGQMTARELLDVSAERIEKDFAAYPETQHDLLGYFAEIYAGLSEDKRYDELRERQRLLIAKHYPPLSVQAIEWSLSRINRICDGNQTVECEQLLRSVDEQIKQAGRDDSSLRAQWLRFKGLHLAKRPMVDAEVRAAYIGAIALFEKHEPRSMRLVDAITDLAVAYGDVFDFPRAIEQYQRALRVSASISNPAANQVAKLYASLAHALSSAGRYDEAIEALRASATLVQKSVGPNHFANWFAQGQLATVYNRTGRRIEALQVFTEVLPHLPDAATMNYHADALRRLYADTLVHEWRAAEAIEILEEIRRRSLRSSGNGDYDFLQRALGWSIGSAYLAAGRMEDAKRELKAALDEALRQEKTNSQFVLAFREAYGHALMEAEDVDGAFAQFTEIVSQAQGRKLSHIALAYGGLARVAVKRGQPELALEQSAMALDTWTNKTGVSSARMEPRLQRMRADALAAAGRFEEAQKFEDDAWRASQKFDGPSNPTTQRRVMKQVSAPSR